MLWRIADRVIQVFLGNWKKALLVSLLFLVAQMVGMGFIIPTISLAVSGVAM